MQFPTEDALAELILEALTGGAQSGFEISRILEQEFGVSLRGREGALYAELVRLERQGFVAGAWEDTPEGRRRRYLLPVLVDLNALTASEASR